MPDIYGGICSQCGRELISCVCESIANEKKEQKSDYEKAKERLKDFHQYTLGQEVETELGRG
jgi:hypothetical protein